MICVVHGRRFSLVIDSFSGEKASIYSIFFIRSFRIRAKNAYILSLRARSLSLSLYHVFVLYKNYSRQNKIFFICDNRSLSKAVVREAFIWGGLSYVIMIKFVYLVLHFALTFKKKAKKNDRENHPKYTS